MGGRLKSWPVIAGLLLTVACGPARTLPPESYERQLEQRLEVPPEQLEALLAKGAVLLDVRMPDEFAAGHLPDAINIPIAVLYDGRLNALPHTKPILVYSEEGMLSAGATSFLFERRYDVYHLGPMSRWQEMRAAESQ